VPAQAFGSPSTFSTSSRLWSDPTVSLSPGIGVFLNNTTGASLPLNFIGSVSTGPQSVTIPAGSNQAVLSSILPISTGLDTLGFPALDGDLIYFYDPVAGYTEDEFAAGYGWFLAEPTPNLGQAFIFEGYYTSPSRSWTQDLSLFP
jgi:hypothetical protein